MLDASLVPPDVPSGGETRRGLFYPWGRWTPAPGQLHEVAPGVLWLRMPLPIALNHINLWVLDDGDGWAIVDTGFKSEVCKDVWRAAFDGSLAGRRVTQVIGTHYHPDHIGLAGWLCHKHGAPLVMTLGEYLLARVLTLDVAPAPPDSAVRFYARSGWPRAAIERMAGQQWGRFASAVSRLPIGFARVRAGDVLSIGGRDWRIVVGSGHSPEHACLVCDELGLMIAGDQLLPRITSNVSVYPTEPDADPLGEWIDSLDRLEALDAGLRVLPAHGEPYDGLRDRTQQLRQHHFDKLDALDAFCDVPRTAFESFGTLFGRPIKDDEIMMATGEALSHLHYLERRGRLRRVADADADRFVRC